MARKRVMLRDGRTTNALRHGCRSNQPVIGDEDPAEWEQHLQGITDSIGPANQLERQLAYRIALACWKMYRIDAYEVAVCNANHDRAGEHARQAMAGRNAVSPLNADELRALAVLPGRSFEKIERYRQAEERSLARALRTLSILRDLQPAAARKVREQTTATQRGRRLVPEHRRRPASRLNLQPRQNHEREGGQNPARFVPAAARVVQRGE